MVLNGLVTSKSKLVNLSHARTEAQQHLMERIALEGACPFCEKYLLRYHKKPILKRATHWLVTTNMYPYKGACRHILFISRKHIENPAELRSVAWKELGELSKWAILSFRIPGGSLFMRFGNTEYTGATISHLHVHMMSGGQRIKRGKQNVPIKTLLAYSK